MSSLLSRRINLIVVLLVMAAIAVVAAGVVSHSTTVSITANGATEGS